MMSGIFFREWDVDVRLDIDRSDADIVSETSFRAGVLLMFVGWSFHALRGVTLSS